jgi:hypothetical protein
MARQSPGIKHIRSEVSPLHTSLKRGFNQASSSLRLTRFPEPADCQDSHPAGKGGEQRKEEQSSNEVSVRSFGWVERICQLRLEEISLQIPQKKSPIVEKACVVFPDILNIRWPSVFEN